LQPLTVDEMKQTEGGCFLVGLIIGIAVAIVYLVVTDNGGHDVDCNVDTCNC